MVPAVIIAVAVFLSKKFELQFQIAFNGYENIYVISSVSTLSSFHVRVHSLVLMEGSERH